MIDRFNEEIIAMREDGALDILYKRWWYDLGSCESDSSSLESTSLSTANFAGVFIIFGGFAIITLVIVVLENVTYYGKKAVYRRMEKATQHSVDNVDPVKSVLPVDGQGSPNEEDQSQEKEEMELEMELRQFKQQPVQSLDAVPQSQDHETKGDKEEEINAEE